MDVKILMTQRNVDNCMLALIVILWAVVSIIVPNSSTIGFIGLAIAYRKISKRIKGTESSEGDKE